MSPPSLLEDGGIELFISEWEDGPASLTANTTAWAIGDVHGQDDLLEALLVAVRMVSSGTAAHHRHLVTLGDYIDRGPGSIAALRRAAEIEMPGVQITPLLGNHEVYLYDLLYDDDFDQYGLDHWVANGGLFTLKNLGVGPEDLRRGGAAGMIEKVRATVPEAVRAGLGRLRIMVRLGGYLFVHAGVHPRQPLDATSTETLTTIREPFLSGRGWSHDFAVVHGHSIIGPDIAPHRIAVDSGAFWTGVLTCVEISGDKVRFIAAARNGDMDRLRVIPGRRALSSESWRPLRPEPA